MEITEKYNITVAGHVIRIESRFPENRRFFRDYMADDSAVPEVSASVTEDDIEKILSKYPGGSYRSAEIAALLRPVAESFPFMGGIIFHGAAVSYEKKAYIFTAPSGTGKSTHIKLWRKHLGESVDIINGDKPIITADERGVLVHGTPWSGKELWQKNVSFPIGGICLLKRGENSIRTITSAEALPVIFTQTYKSKDADVTAKTMELLDKILGSTPLYELYCDISETAAKCSFTALTGKNFDECKADVK